MLGQIHPRGVTMRDCLNNRGGFDRVLMAVAASFLAVSATSAMAQNLPPRSSAAELAIEAAIPRPEPANVPPPTAADIKLDTTATVAEPVKSAATKTEATKPAETAQPTTEAAKPAEQTAPTPATVATTPAVSPKQDGSPKSDTATAPAAASTAPAT